MTLEQLVARVNANSFFITEPWEKVGRRAKKHRLVLAAQRLGRSQVAALLRIMEGSSKVVDGYEVRRGKDVYLVESLEDGTVRRVALDFSGCSCEDSKYRSRECKHMRLVKRAAL